MKLKENVVNKNVVNKLEKVTNNERIIKVIYFVKNSLQEVLDTPKWGYPILFLWWLIWFSLWCTVLIFVPWTTIIFIVSSSKIVKKINNRLI